MMKKYIVILLMGIKAVCQQSPDTSRETMKRAINTSRKALMAVPVIRQTLQQASEDVLRNVGIEEYQVRYIAPTALAIQGRLTTKYFKNFRYKREGFSAVPLMEYHLREDSYRLELNLFYSF